MVMAGKLKLRQDVISGGGYASQSDRCLHFGIGAASSIDTIEVRWPDGQTTVTKKPGIDRVVTIDERRSAPPGTK